MISAEAERITNGHFKVIHNESAMRADVYLAGSDELIGWALDNRVVREIENEHAALRALYSTIRR